MEKFVDEYLKNFSFDLDSFNDAKYELHFGDYCIIYDRLSLCVYSHSFPTIVWKEFRDKLTTKFANYSNEIIKQRKEYAIFFEYAQKHTEFLSAKIKKEVRPDFTAKLENRYIGIEITELTTPEDKILCKILEENRTHKATADMVKEVAIKKHGSKARRYNYYNIDDGFGIGSNVVSVDWRKNYYSNAIMKKYNKYKNEFANFDKFVILCHLTDPLIGEEYEVEEIMNLFCPNKKSENLEVSIKYVNENNKTSFIEKTF